LFAPVFVGQEWVFLSPHWSETVFTVKKRKSIAVMPSSRRCRRFTMVRFWFWRENGVHKIFKLIDVYEINAYLLMLNCFHL
jgi:hypothetical protein